MKALTFQGEGEVKIIDVPKPSIKGSGEALVKVTLGAVCGSDLHILHGHTPINQGAVLGHEFVGVIEDVGGEVKRFKPGDRVVARLSTWSCPTPTTRWSRFPQPCRTSRRSSSATSSPPVSSGPSGPRSNR